MDKLCNFLVSKNELNSSLKNNESTILFSYSDNSYKAIDLAIGELLGDPNLINKQIEMYNSINSNQIMSESIAIFDAKNHTSLYYGK